MLQRLLEIAEKDLCSLWFVKQFRFNFKRVPLSLIPAAVLLFIHYLYKEIIEATDWLSTIWWGGTTIALVPANFSILIGHLHFISHLLAVLTLATGLHFAPAFQDPFLSTSPRDFWTRRWNLIFRNYSHRHVFMPIRKLLGHPGYMPVRMNLSR